MLLEIYESMLETAKNGKVPEYVELVFHIDKKQSVEFWENRDDAEMQMLFMEWDSKKESRYYKQFYGIRFAIQFDNSSERLTKERHEQEEKIRQIIEKGNAK